MEPPLAHIKFTTELPTAHGKCEKFCVPLDICSSLFILLRDPTDENLRTLRKASCGFTTDEEPMVWCHDAVCLDRLLNDRVLPEVTTSSESTVSPKATTGGNAEHVTSTALVKAQFAQ